MPRDYHSRATTPAFSTSWDRMHADGELDLSMDRYLREGDPEETYAAWKHRQRVEVSEELHG